MHVREPILNATIHIMARPNKYSTNGFSKQVVAYIYDSIP